MRLAPKNNYTTIEPLTSYEFNLIEDEPGSLGFIDGELDFSNWSGSISAVYQNGITSSTTLDRAGGDVRVDLKNKIVTLETPTFGNFKHADEATGPDWVVDHFTSVGFSITVLKDDTPYTSIHASIK